MARRFGLGARLGIDLPGERAGLVPDKAWKRAALNAHWHQGETLVVGIGQGFLQATPLQLAVMTARIATGRAVLPSIVRGAAAQSAQAAAGPAPPIGVSDWSLAVVRRGMFEVVNGERGTARAYRLSQAGARHGRQDRHLAGAAHLAQRAPDRPAQERGEALGGARPRPVRRLRAL